MSNRGRYKSNKHPVEKILGKRICNLIKIYQKQNGNIANLDVFLHDWSAGPVSGGFAWRSTPEGHDFWEQQLTRVKNSIYYTD